MRILLTNDDGYDAPGLRALYEAVRSLGDVTVVAPAVCHSSRGHAVECKRPLTLRTQQVEAMGLVHIVESSPADCVRVGLNVVLDSAPDFVIAGINPGANLGVDVYYSGTVAAAREAAIAGIPAVAISRYMTIDTELRWNEVVTQTRSVLNRLLQESLARGEFWNVNLPAVEDNQVRGLAWVPHSTETQSWGYKTTLSDNGNSQELAFSGPYSERLANQPADVRYVFDGYATVSRLQLDTSCDASVVCEKFPQNGTTARPKVSKSSDEN